MPKWKDAGAGIVVTNDDDDEQDGNRSDRENERPADNTMNSPLPSPVANWKYSAARAYENLNRILTDVKLLGADVDILMTPRLTRRLHSAVESAFSDGDDAISPVGGGEQRGEEGGTEDDVRREEHEEADERRCTAEEEERDSDDESTFADERRSAEESMRKQWAEEEAKRKSNIATEEKNRMKVDATVAAANRLLAEKQKREEEKRLVERIEEQKKLVERILRARGRRSKGREIEDERCKDDDEIAAEKAFVDERRQRMEERGLEDERREDDDEIAAEEAFPDGCGRMMEEGGMEHERCREGEWIAAEETVAITPRVRIGRAMTIPPRVDERGRRMEEVGIEHRRRKAELEESEERRRMAEEEESEREAAATAAEEMRRSAVRRRTRIIKKIQKHQLEEEDEEEEEREGEREASEAQKIQTECRPLAEMEHSQRIREEARIEVIKKLEVDTNRLLVDELEAAVTEAERRRRAIEEAQDSSRKKLENEANRLLTERHKLLGGANLAERILQARRRRTQEGGVEDERRKEENENAIKESMIEEGGRRMEEGGIEHERRKEEHEEAEEMRRLAENKEMERERQMHMEREKQRDKERVREKEREKERERERKRERERERELKREAAAAAAEEKMRAEERMREEEEEEDRKRKFAVEREMRKKVEAAVAETESRQRAIKEARDVKKKELAEKEKCEEQHKLVERILLAANNDAKVKNAHYSVLNISPTSTMTEIKKSYRKLALRLHPDKDRYATPNSAEAFKAITCAYDVLKDASSRSEYDRAQSSVVLKGPPSAFNTFPSGTRITVQSTDTRFTNLNGQQGSILGYDVVADLYLVKVDHHCEPIWSKKSALFQNVIVCLRAAKAKELGAFFVTLLSYYKDHSGGCYQASYPDVKKMTTRTAYLRAEQFIIPNGTVVHVDDGVYGMVVDWKERVDQHSTADGSYYEVGLSHSVGVRIQMANIRL